MNKYTVELSDSDIALISYALHFALKDSGRISYEALDIIVRMERAKEVKK